MAAASAAGAQDITFRPPPVEMTLAFQERLATVYLPMNLSDDELLAHMSRYFGQEFSMVENTDRTRSMVHIIRREEGRIVYYVTIAILPAR